MRIYRMIEMVLKRYRLVSTTARRHVSLPFLFCFNAACVAFLTYCMAKTRQTQSHPYHFTLKPPLLFAA